MQIRFKPVCSPSRPFILALSVTSDFSNQAKVEEEARQEALEISRLNRELGALGDIAATGRQALMDYARDVGGRMEVTGKSRPHLSLRVQRDIDKLSGQKSA